MSTTIKIILVDDHLIVRNGIKALLEELEYVEIVGEASNGVEALEVIKKVNPDIAIMDIRMPVMTGLEACNEIKKKDLRTKVLILSMHDTEDYVLQAARNGAFGYLLKDSELDDFERAINRIHKGEKHFSSAVSHIILNDYLNKTSITSDTSSINQTNIAIDNQLTKAEKNILKLIREGMTNQEIGEQLGKSTRTIETHRFNMMKKLNVKNVAELITLTQFIEI